MEEFLNNKILETNITNFGQDHINGLGGSYDPEMNNKEAVQKNKFDYTAFTRDFKDICRKEKRRMKLRSRSKRRRNKL